MRKEGSRDSCDNGSRIPKLYAVSVGAESTPADLRLLPHRPWRGDANSQPQHQADCGRCSVTYCMALLVSPGKLICSLLFGLLANIITLTD